MVNIRTAYSDWAATYDTDGNRTRDLDQEVCSIVLANFRPRVVLEIGCGTGKNTAFLAQIAGHVLALDFSPGMIEKAKEKLPADMAAFALADITEPWPIAVQAANLIVCNLVLEHIEHLSHIFSEAFRTLAVGGHFFLCELHPFRQYQGTKANFQRGIESREIQAFVHHISDFLEAAENNGLVLKKLKEWQHPEDHDKPPRLISFLFEKPITE